jgi:hypothetical protein
VRKRYKVSTRPPATLPLSPRVSNCPFSLPALDAQLTSPRVLVAVFRVCGNGDYGVCYVSQHEEVSTRVCAAYQAPHAVAGDGTHEVTGDGTHAVAAEAPRAVTADGTHAVAGDGSHAVAADWRARTCAAATASQLDADGQALRKRLRAFRTQAVRKNYKVSKRPPATLPLSPRVLKCVFLLRLSTHNSPLPVSS